MDERLPLPALEYHVAHGCNLSCQQCSHYSNFHVAGKLPTIEDAEADYAKWSHRLKPRRFALLGGEPLLNPQIIEHIQLARKHWSDSNLMLVTNGFFLHRFPELPAVLTRHQLPARSQPTRNPRRLRQTIPRSEATRLAMARTAPRHSDQDPPIASRLDAAIQRRKRQTDAVRFQTGCRVQSLHAEDLHAASPAACCGSVPRSRTSPNSKPS